MEYFNQKNILPVILDAKTGDIKSLDRLLVETKKFLFSEITELARRKEGVSGEKTISSVIARIRDDIHRYSPASEPYTLWVRNILDAFIESPEPEMAGEVAGTPVKWRWELAFAEHLSIDPFDTAFLKIIRNFSLEKLSGIIDREERKAFILPFQETGSAARITDITGLNEEKLNSLFISALKKFRKKLFESREFMRLACLVKLVVTGLSNGILITSGELELINESRKRKILSLSMEKESSAEAAEELETEEASYVEDFFKACESLCERLPRTEEAAEYPRKAQKEDTSDITEDIILKYREHLLGSETGYVSTCAKDFQSADFAGYRIIMDFIYKIFTARSKPPGINELLIFAVKKNSSDLHLSAGMPPILRIDGDIRRIDLPALNGHRLQQMIESIMKPKQVKIYSTEYEIDFSYELADGTRFRVNAFQQYRGPAIAFRVIPAKLIQLEDIGFANVLRKIADIKSGLVLVTGPTGAGKTTTLSALIEYKNNRDFMNILTIEDPVEYLHKSSKCLINQREVYKNTRSFSSALRAGLREDPDVILIGEMRDLETIRLALTAAETGHLVIATLHTRNAPQTIDRIIDIFPADEKGMVRFMLAETLQAVVSQSLLKKKGGGRIAALEIMIVNSAIRNLIREENISQIYSTIQLSKAEDMHTLEQHLLSLVEEGIIDPENAYSHAANKRYYRIIESKSRERQEKE